MQVRSEEGRRVPMSPRTNAGKPVQSARTTPVKKAFKPQARPLAVHTSPFLTDFTALTYILCRLLSTTFINYLAPVYVCPIV